MVKFWRRNAKDQSAALAWLSRASGYDRMTRHSDFRAVFTGHSTPVQGQRVLSQICRWGGLYAPVVMTGDPYATHARAGAQELCQRIVSVLNIEPQEMPDRAQSEE